MLTDPIDSLVLFIVTLLLLIMAAYGGKFIFKRRQERAQLEDEEAKLVLGALLSFVGLLLGFALTVAIGGYSERLATEESEAIAIASAMQSTQLLNPKEQRRAEQFIKQYLEARIAFFITGIGEENEHWLEVSFERQAQLWQLAAERATEQPNSVNAFMLKAYGRLYETLLHTQASWHHRIPAMAWWLLLAFAFCANGLIGYNIRGIKGENWLIVILPVLTTAAFYLTAEIDIPGEGVIRVIPDNLIEVKKNLNSSVTNIKNSNF